MKTFLIFFNTFFICWIKYLLNNNNNNNKWKKKQKKNDQKLKDVGLYQKRKMKQERND
jgi:hypothetical protein